MAKQSYIRLFTVYLCFFLIWTYDITIAEAQKSTDEPASIKIGTSDLPPYGWEASNHEKHGIIYELNQEIGIRSGLSFINIILPINRMYRLLKNGEIDLISSQAHQAARDAGDKLAIQFDINVIAATKKGSGIHKIEDFKGKNLIYHHSASYAQLEGLPQNIQRVRSYRQILDLLYSRPHTDGAVFSEPAYYYWMRVRGLTPADFGEVIMIERDKAQWIFVRKGLPQNTRTMLKQIVEDIYREDLYEELLKKYGKR